MLSAAALPLGAAEDVIGRHAKKSGHHLGKCQVLAITFLA